LEGHPLTGKEAGPMGRTERKEEKEKSLPRKISKGGFHLGEGRVKG